MVDKEHDDGGGEDAELSCEITGFSSTETYDTLSKTVFSRLKYLKIGLLVSLFLNVIFMGLFAVVFVKLYNLNTRLSQYEDTLNEIRSNMYAVTQPNVGRTKGDNNELDTSLIDNKNVNVVKSSSRPSLNLMSTTPTQVPKRENIYSTGKSTTDSCKCRGPPGEKGQRGKKGQKGDRGRKGSQGNQGSQGSQGRDGIKGVKGDTGNPGPKGKYGPQGLPGPPGPSGTSGAKGEPGRSCKVCNASLSHATTKVRPVVHLTGSSPTHSGKIEYEPLNIWTTSNVLGHSTYGMFSPASTSQITITEDGQYFIYSQLYFQINFQDTGLNLDKNLKTYMVHFVFRKSGLSETLLMRAVTSNGLVNNRSGFYTSFTCGVHPLKKGDTLFVGVQKKQSVIVNTGDTSSFFGTFKV